MGDKKKNLDQTNRRQQLVLNIEDVELCLSDVEAQIVSEDVGRDLNSLMNSQMRHNLLESDVAAHFEQNQRELAKHYNDLNKEYTNVISQHIEIGFAKMVEDHFNEQVWHLPHRHGFTLVIYCMVYLYPLQSIFRPEARYFSSVSLLRTSKQPVLSRIMDFYVDVQCPVRCLDVADAFCSLGKSEKDYVFSCTQAPWVGGLIGLIQTSPESAGIFLFIYRFRSRDVYSFTEEAKKTNFSKEEINHLLSYLASVLDNLGNYVSFRATKFVPAITLSRVKELLSVNSAETGLKALWEEVAPAIYSLSSRRLRLGFGTTEITTYYSVNCTHSDAELIQNELMKLLVDCCKNSKAHSLDQIESEMWHQYAESFNTGSVASHKDASRLWVKDKNPVVENHIGLIESYRDSFGVCAKFELFVAVVNRSVSTKFQRLVNNAERLSTNLPWPSTFERVNFLQPDFTSLNVVTFAASEILVGTNIPNYDDCRAENVGIYLSDLPLVLEQFGLNTDCAQGDVPDVFYNNWLSTIPSVSTSTEFCSPAENPDDIGSWRQAHNCACYGIPRVLIEADNSMVRTDEAVGKDDAPDLCIFFGRKRLLTVTRSAIGEFLRKLQDCKGKANAKDGCAFFQHYSQPLPQHLTDLCSLFPVTLLCVYVIN
ncbi:unnamed protein product [Trichobilharzia regenti]|nr:unnamed protein product [Trichobilharzia regenti]